MKIQLYILGLLLRSGPQHGYGLKQIIKKEVSDFTQIKLPTIYYHLEKMEKQGYISSSQIQDSPRPERMEYKILSKGKVFFLKTLNNLLLDDHYKSEFIIDAVFYFYNFLEWNDIEKALKIKVKRLKEKQAYLDVHQNEMKKHIPEEHHRKALAIFRHHQLHNQAEIQWMEEILDQ